MNKKTNLKKQVMRFLMAGTVALVPFVGSAETVDMTTPENIGGVVISDPENEVESSYLYKWDASAKEIIGGTVRIVSNENDNYIMPRLIIKADDFDGMNAAETGEALDLLKDKIYNEIENDRWRIHVSAEIIDDTSGEETVLRKFNLKFPYGYDGSNSQPTGYSLTGGVFRSVLQNDGAADSEYEFNEEGHWYTPFGNYTVDPIFVSADDNIYAAIRSSDRAGGVTNILGSSTDNSSLSIVADASTFANSRAYGVYANTSGPLLVSMSEGTMTVKGNKAVGFYAGNENTEKSEIAVGGKIAMNIDGATAVGIEAGKNGIIHSHERTGSKKITISVPNGSAIYAHDGGEIKLDFIHIAESNEDAIVANTGGNIKIGKAEGFTGNIKTDDDVNSHIHITVKGNLTGDVIGNVDLRLENNVEWIGNNLSNNKIELDGAHWTGAILNEKGILHIRNNGSWSFGPDSTENVTVAKFIGGDSPGLRGYVNMGNSHLNIADYSGHGTFVYQHGETDTTEIIGGNVMIEAANPLVISSEGLGEGEETQVSTSPSTITIATPIDGIDTTDEATVEKVLANLADKLTYLNYAKGERNLSGTVEIQEGLTGSAVAKHFSDIVFDEKTGKATIGNIIAPHTSMITGYAPDDIAYADVYDVENAVFNFTEDTHILQKKSEDDRPGFHWGGFYYGLINNYGSEFNHQSGWSLKSEDGPSYTIDMHGNDLTVDLAAYPPAGSTGGQPMWTTAAIFALREGTITINNPGKVNLSSNANFYYGSVIRASTANPTPTGAHVIINNDRGNLADHVVTLRGGINSPGYEMNYRTLETYINSGADYQNDNSITIKGLVDIKSRYGAALYARGGNINLGGGRIEAEKYDAIWTTDNGQVNVNVITDEAGNVTDIGNNDVILYGNASGVTDYYGGGGTINLAFVTENSLFEGQIYGINGAELNRWLQNGATWNNIPQLFHPWSGSEIIRDRPSHPTHLYGGADTEHAGNIYQTSEKDISVENIEGYVNFFVKHNKEEIANFDHVGGISINHALQTKGKNASVTLITDALSKADLENENTVKAVLNALANKMYYLSYVDDERNLDAKVQISEGLTSYSAAWIKRGEIAFKDEDGQGFLKDDKVETNPHPTEEPRPKVVYVGENDEDRNMRQYYDSDDQLYIYKHNPDNPSEVYGGGITIGNADPESRIRLRTDNDGIDIHDASEVRDVLNGLAGKLTYQAYVDGERNLDGQAEIAEGLTAYSAMMKFGNIKYNDKTGQGYFDDMGDIRTVDPEIIYGPKETAMMRGAKSAMTGAMLTWREENNDLNKRLGAIRFADAEAGVWGRIYGGRAKYDNDNVDYKTDFKAVQVGYDKEMNADWRAGLAFSYIDGDNKYRLGGEGDTKIASLAVYGTKVNDDGSYIDLVAKGSRVDTDYTVYNDMRYKLEGDYKTNGFSLSAEYGKKIERDNGLYFIPQAELTYGNLSSKDYDAKSDYAGGKLMHVEQGSFDSLIGRLGLSVGKETATTDMYAKLSVLHEFKGGVTTTYSAEGEPTSVTEQDFGDTWFVLGIGGTHELTDDTYIYGNLERSFGGDMETEWRADLGVRWMF